MSFKPKGIVVPIVTPLTPDGKFNEAAYRRLIDYLADNGIHGVFPFGTTGEFYAFDQGFYDNGLEGTKDAVKGRMDSYAGANHITTFKWWRRFTQKGRKGTGGSASRPAAISG